MKADRIAKTFRLSAKVQALKRTKPHRFQVHYDRFSRVANGEKPFSPQCSNTYFETPLGSVRAL